MSDYWSAGFWVSDYPVSYCWTTLELSTVLVGLVNVFTSGPVIPVAALTLFRGGLVQPSRVTRS